jgi:hypothetical protein
MAELLVDDDDVVIKLTLPEMLLAWHRQVRVPVASVRMVHVEDDPLAGFPWCRPPGLAWPGAFAVGSRRRSGRRELAVAHAHAPALVLDTSGGPWDRIVVTHADAAAIAAELAGRVLARRPAKPSRRGFPAPLD